MEAAQIIRDAVPNHIGDQHYWMQDLPFKDWVNPWPEITRDGLMSGLRWATAGVAIAAIVWLISLVTKRWEQPGKPLPHSTAK